MKHLMLALCLSLSAFIGQTDAQNIPQELREHPGFVNFTELNREMRGEANVEVFLKGALLRMVAEAARVEDPMLADMLLKIKGVTVFVYGLNESKSSIESELLAAGDAVAEKLYDSNWDQVVRVRDVEDGNVWVFYRSIADKLEGITVMAIGGEDNEAVFVNIAGQIDPAEVGRLGQKFDIDVLEDL